MPRDTRECLVSYDVAARAKELKLDTKRALYVVPRDCTFWPWRRQAPSPGQGGRIGLCSRLQTMAIDMPLSRTMR